MLLAQCRLLGGLWGSIASPSLLPPTPVGGGVAQQKPCLKPAPLDINKPLQGSTILS